MKWPPGQVPIITATSIHILLLTRPRREEYSKQYSNKEASGATSSAYIIKEVRTTGVGRGGKRTFDGEEKFSGVRPRRVRRGEGVDGARCAVHGVDDISTPD